METWWAAVCFYSDFRFEAVLPSTFPKHPAIYAFFVHVLADKRYKLFNVEIPPERHVIFAYGGMNIPV